MPDETQETNETTLEETIIETAGKAKSVQVDGMRVENRDVNELIAADKYLRQKQQEKSGKLPIRFMKIESR